MCSFSHIAIPIAVNIKPMVTGKSALNLLNSFAINAKIIPRLIPIKMENISSFTIKMDGFNPPA